MSNQETISRVLELVSHLGGPSCTEDEVRWAADIPAGNRLLEWLASQLPDPSFADRVAGSNHDAGPTRDEVSGLIQTSVSPIALYSEELDILDILEVHDARVRGESKGASTPAAYELPSQLRSRTHALESEAVLLEKQAARLKYRLNATKMATKDLKHAIHALRKQIQNLDGSIQGQQQRLTDLSVETDNGMAQHVELALRVLQDAIPTTASKDSDAFEDYSVAIVSLSSSRAAVASTVKQLYLTLDEGYVSLPTASEMQHDATIVDAKLGELAKDKSVSQHLLQVAYVEELVKMAKRLEADPPGPDTIANIVRSSAGLSESREAEISAPTLNVDVKGELERAGRMDRLVLLKAQERGLDTVIDYMRDELIPRLQQTYDDLYSKIIAAVETEAIVSALIEELEDINDAVETAKRSNWNGGPEDPEDLLEAEMIELLKELSNTDGHGSVLLNRKDVEREVSALSARLAASREADEKWVNQLRHRVRELSSSTAPLLSTGYANSPANTSPPFAPSQDQVILETDTRAKAEDLIGAAARLQKETELSSRDKRKLGSFVEKWVQSRD
ncbi:hypothetical protein LXA43DRAFT_1181965 [Ganoderma leucocontextum]|nr:hypothetical protein LXA43DRAFT_1181965 [Ganoderma leucocontextum]